MAEPLPPIDCGRHFTTIAHFAAGSGRDPRLIERLIRENNIVAAFRLNGEYLFDETATALILDKLNEVDGTPDVMPGDTLRWAVTA